jgi:hypothetical protein
MRRSILRNVQGGFLAVPLLLSPAALAQAPPSGQSTGLLQNSTVQSRWQLPVTFEYASSLHSKSAYERKAQESLTLVPSYKLSEQTKLSLMTAIYKDESNDEEGGNAALDTTRIALSHTSPLTTETFWTKSIAGTFSTNRNLREQTSYQGGIKASTGLVFNELIAGSSLVYMLALSRSFHEYNISADGAFNVREILANTLDYTLPLYRELSLQTAFSYSVGHTYNEELRTKFVAEANLNWQASHALAVSAGTSNEGNALGPNGTDSTIEFFNDNSSMLKLGLTYMM